MALRGSATAVGGAYTHPFNMDGICWWTAPMKISLIPAVLLALACQALPADAKIKRSQSAKVEFKQRYPCPATGAHKGPCKG